MFTLGFLPQQPAQAALFCLLDPRDQNHRFSFVLRQDVDYVEQHCADRNESKADLWHGANLILTFSIITPLNHATNIVSVSSHLHAKERCSHQTHIKFCYTIFFSADG